VLLSSFESLLDIHLVLFPENIFLFLITLVKRQRYIPYIDNDLRITQRYKLQLVLVQINTLVCRDDL
jgi:hypothetical protein